ncbi:hypothetical protein HZY91_09035 [Facklamia sp. DSM 111018]|uniref:Bacterial Ig domain-containing protein n=1 Tax=Facklamia lactis TaxID=2749967 RepID=A0ABS0LUI5_9LACT|nr:hypothetical protein [Facklamia lactis]MBG9987031.1 hypothetical protein [Facklamia lactis]
MIKKKRIILLSILMVALSSAWSLFTTSKVSAQEDSEVEETTATTVEESTVEENPVETTIEEVAEEVEESTSDQGQAQFVTINPVYENDHVVSGTASTNTTIAVLYIGKGQMITAGVDEEGNWSVEIPKDFKLKAGEVFQATSISRKLQVVVAEVEVQEAN